MRGRQILAGSDWREDVAKVRERRVAGRSVVCGVSFSFGGKITRLARGTVVVPWVDPEITVATLIDAVVRGYFYPILTGALTVTMETPEKTMVIDDSTLDEAALMLPDAEKRSLRKFNLTTLVGRLTAFAPGAQPSFCA